MDQAGVGHLFGVPGESVLGFYDLLVGSPIPHVRTTREDTAAYAESSPVVAISGAPGAGEQQEDPRIHHRFGPFSVQREIFAPITRAQEDLEAPYTASRQINRALATLRPSQRV
ncbi:MAG: hypothetical protein ACM3ST_12835 [Bdellovibrio bacteriovorus]